MAVRITTATTVADAPVVWPPVELAAGVFRHMVHRVQADARTIRFDGLTYYVANCGAVAVPTDEPRVDWSMCRQCWPDG